MGAGDTTIDAEHKHSFYFLILSISFPRVISLLVIASTSNDFIDSLTVLSSIDDGQASRSLSVNITSRRLQIEIELNYKDTLPKI